MISVPPSDEFSLEILSVYPTIAMFRRFANLGRSASTHVGVGAASPRDSPRAASGFSVRVAPGREYRTGCALVSAVPPLGIEIVTGNVDGELGALRGEGCAGSLSTADTVDRAPVGAN